MGEGSTEKPVPVGERRELGFQSLARAFPGPCEYSAGCGRPQEGKAKERMDRS